MLESVDQDRRRSRVGSDIMGDRHLQLHRPVSIEKIAVAEKAKSGAASHEAPAVSITTPRTAAAAAKQHLPGSPRQQCLCSPTMHAGSFRCRLHRGIGGGGGGGSVGSGLHEMSKKPGSGGV